MKVIVKLKEKIIDKKNDARLVLLLWEKGTGIEYSVHTEIKGEYHWGYYFPDWQDNGLENALEYYHKKCDNYN